MFPNGGLCCYGETEPFRTGFFLFLFVWSEAWFGEVGLIAAGFDILKITGVDLVYRTEDMGKYKGKKYLQTFVVVGEGIPKGVSKELELAIMPRNLTRAREKAAFQLLEQVIPFEIVVSTDATADEFENVKEVLKPHLAFFWPLDVAIGFGKRGHCYYVCVLARKTVSEVISKVYGGKITDLIKPRTIKIFPPKTKPGSAEHDKDLILE